MTKSKGLGDSLEKAFKATGIDKVAKKVLGDDCGCEKRKQALNKIFPYARPFTDDELKMIARYLTYRIKRERDGKPNSNYSTMRKALYRDEKVLAPSLELMTAIKDSLNLK